MARINYHAITKAIQAQLRADGELRRLGAQVDANKPVPTTLADAPHVGVFEARRDPTALQPVAAGTRQRYAVRWEVWCSAFSADSYDDACGQRDELLGIVELALMRDRTLGGAVANGSLMLGGGEFRGGPREGGGLIAQATLVVTVEATADTA